MESELLCWLRGRLPAHPRLRLGPGDDAALLRLADGGECLATVDLLSDGVDFRLADTSPRRIGHKALAVNLSDLAAMAARPLGAVVALCLPRTGGLQVAQQLYEGMIPLAERFDSPIAGGDINSWDGPLVISITVLGECLPPGPLLRSGARPGDRIVVTGAFGGSILGRHLDVEPRIVEAQLLLDRYRLHAGIDVSDGLSIDLSRLAEASGCGAVVDLDRVPIHPAARELATNQADGTTALDHALSDGEDFELILAVAAEEARRMFAEQPVAVGLTDIGQFVAEPGLWHSADTPQGREPLEIRGWQHRFDP